ncbi:efflux RND transporter periplasmic adaptor subunit [Variovorax ginsengisoli]|uniref:Cobalt-zinc-cadmium efflux system membrane fusion protein n=1 Tax=Variovorax ginsengisoli TaxID=363844 RepID=A0ABT9SEK4_9BURK|nr:efflux RND transporter periplasmic adaptor subunit [Variovorax ginsengisoli]MDP9902790.1 cobalt-zinc-cadmium efflux system membrane fusion protein [Variovorax ginsengisoli]
MANTPSTSGGAHRRKQHIVIVCLIALGIIAGALILRSGSTPKTADAHGAHTDHGTEGGDHADEGKDDGHRHAEGGAQHEEEQVAKGPHGGQRFTEGDFGLELLLAEEGGQPRLKAWVYDKGRPAALAGTQVMVSLARPDGTQEEIRLTPKGEELQSEQVVAEPHVFEATVAVQTPRQPYRFTFSAQEGKVAMTDAQIQAAGIALDTSAPAVIRSALQFPGEIRFNEDRTAHIVPRAAGVVESVSANLGAQVRRGDVLAVVSSATVSELRSELQGAQRRRELASTTYAREKQLWEQKISPEQDVQQARQALRETEISVANATQKLRTLGAAASGASLGRFELRAPFDGMVVEKHIALGEAVKEDASVFTLSDLSSVWAEMSISANDLAQVRVGERVVVRTSASDAKADGTISFVGSLIGEQTRTARARVVLPNPQGAWRPGLFVTVEVVGDETSAPVTVASSAVQTVDDKPAVFLKVEGGFIAQPVTLGRTDGKRVEVVSGLKPGARYVAAGSFIVKSEQGKGSATHTH